MNVADLSPAWVEIAEHERTGAWDVFVAWDNINGLVQEAYVVAIRERDGLHSGKVLTRWPAGWRFADRGWSNPVPKTVQAAAVRLAKRLPWQ